MFQAGVPVFRRYDAQGRLLWERHIEGPELDGLLAALPTSWPRSPGAAASAWSSARPADRPHGGDRSRAAICGSRSSVPFTYVYDSVGDKRRTVQFSAPGLLSPTSLFFTANPAACSSRPAVTSSTSSHQLSPPVPRSRLRSSGRRSNCVAISRMVSSRRMSDRPSFSVSSSVSVPCSIRRMA